MIDEPEPIRCPTCTLPHNRKSYDPSEPFDLNDCLMNALGEIGEFATRMGEKERAIDRLLVEIDEKDSEIEELELDLRLLTAEVDD